MALLIPQILTNADGDDIAPITSALSVIRQNSTDNVEESLLEIEDLIGDIGTALDEILGV